MILSKILLLRKNFLDMLNAILLTLKKTTPSLQKYLSENRKHSRKKFFFPRNLLSIIFSRQVGFSFDNTAGKTRQKMKLFWQESRNICSKKWVSLETISFSPKFPRKLKQIFDIPANKARQISEDHSFDLWKTLWLNTLFEKICPRYFPLDQ